MDPNSTAGEAASDEDVRWRARWRLRVRVEPGKHRRVAGRPWLRAGVAGRGDGASVGRGGAVVVGRNGSARPM